MGKGEHKHSTRDAVMTPPEVYEPVLRALGWDRFDLDPCSHPRALVPASVRVLLPEYRGQEVTWAVRPQILLYGDGLEYDWRGARAFLNPPYSRLQHWEKEPWLEKARTAARCVAFLPVRPMSEWWHRGVRRAQATVELRERVKHVGEEYTATFHQCLVLFGFTPEELDALARHYERNGHWFRPCNPPRYE